MFYVCTLMAIGIGYGGATLRGESVASWITGALLLWGGVFGVILWRHESRLRREIAAALQEQFWARGPDESMELIAQEIAETGRSTYVELWERYGRYGRSR